MIETLLIEWDVDEASGFGEHISSLIMDVLLQLTLYKKELQEHGLYYVDEIPILFNDDVDGSYFIYSENPFIEDFMEELSSQLSDYETIVNMDNSKCSDKEILNIFKKLEANNE